MDETDASRALDFTYTLYITRPLNGLGVTVASTTSPEYYCTIIQLQLLLTGNIFLTGVTPLGVPTVVSPSAWRQLAARHLRPSLTQPHRRLTNPLDGNHAIL